MNYFNFTDKTIVSHEKTLRLLFSEVFCKPYLSHSCFPSKLENLLQISIFDNSLFISNEPEVKILLKLVKNENISTRDFLILNLETWPRGYKTFFMLDSTEHENFPARKC